MLTPLTPALALQGQDEPGDGAAQDLPAGGSGGDAPAPAAAPEAARAEKADKARDQPASTRKTNRNKENIDVLQAPTEPTEYAKSRCADLPPPPCDGHVVYVAQCIHVVLAQRVSQR